MQTQSDSELSTRPAEPAPRRRWRGNVVAVLVVCAVGALAWFVTHRTAPGPRTGFAAAGGASSAASAGKSGAPAGPTARRTPPSTVGTATAEARDLPVVLEALGTVTPTIVATVIPQVSGVLTQVLYTEGQTVKKGQLLAVIDPRSFQIALQQASGARQRDEAQLQNAQVTLERYRTLLQQDSIARQDVDTQAALVKQLEGTLAVDRSAQATAQLNLSYSRVVAPVAGRVGLRPVDVGNVVGPGSNGGIAVITQMAPIDVVFALPQDRVPQVQDQLHTGARLPVTALDRTRTARLGTGSFLTLDNQIDVQTGTVKAKARFANTDGSLFPNQFVNVQLLLRSIAGAVVVPVTALRHGSDGDFVYVVQADQTVSVRPVKRGESTADLVQVVSGLAAGEQVVTEGGDRLKDGMRVQLADAAGAARGASSAGPGQRGRRSRPEGAAAPASASAASQPR